MSAKNRKTQSKVGDRYYTEPRLARILTRVLRKQMIEDHGESSVSSLRILEPSAGTGSFVNACHREFGDAASVSAVEMHTASIMMLEEQGIARVYGGTIEDRIVDVKKSGAFDLVIGNPPYTYAESHIRLGFEAMKDGGYQAQLLRQGFFSTDERAEFWKEYPLKYMYQLVERPSFFGSGNDASEYALFVWQKGFRWPDGFQRVCHLAWKKKIRIF